VRLRCRPRICGMTQNLIQADERIDFGHVGGKLLREALGHAARDDELLAGLDPEAALLVRLEDGFDGFLLGRVDKSAGVDDEDIGLAGVGSDLHPLP
jgi:hypothetical protein